MYTKQTITKQFLFHGQQWTQMPGLKILTTCLEFEVQQLFVYTQYLDKNFTDRAPMSLKHHTTYRSSIPHTERELHDIMQTGAFVLTLPVA